jgi:hypothetical protein
MAAFGDLTLGEGAYEFLNGSINLVGHDGLLPILKKMKDNAPKPLVTPR